MDGANRRKKMARSTVSLNEGDYARLKELAAGNRPPVPVRFVIELAIVQFLDGMKKGDAPRIGVLATRAGK